MQSKRILYGILKLGISSLCFVGIAVHSAMAVELKVLSGNGSRPAVIEICKLFEEQTGHQVKVEFAVNPHVRDRVDKGEYVDVVVLNPPVLDELVNSQKVIASSKTPFGRIGVGAAIGAGASKLDISTTESFKKSLLGVSSVAFPGDGASGKYFVSLLSRMGIEQEMKTKLRPMSGEYNVEGVAKGEVDMIVVVASRIYGVAGVQYLGLIPTELQTWIGFSAGVSRESKYPKEAQQLTQFFKQDQARQIMKKIGIEPIID
jgi:molybdate transport system substrate-binding protein